MSIIIRYGEPIYKNKFNEYQKSGFGLLNQSLSKNGIKDIILWKSMNKFGRVFCAESSICKETAKYLSHDFTISKDLNNIIHDFKSFDTKNKCLTTIRQNSLKSYYNDQNIESKKSVLNRFQKIKTLLKENKNSVFISHGYFMKALEFDLKLGISPNIALADKYINQESKKPFFSSMQGFKL